MNVNELIELLLLRHQGSRQRAVFGMFDPEDVATVYLELIINWYLVENTSIPDPERSKFLLDSRVMLTPKGRRRLTELESKISPMRRSSREREHGAT